MFGLGVWEIALICVALLMFVRPEELPRVMRKLGTLYGRVTGSSRRIMRQLQFPEGPDDDPARDDPGYSIAADGGREAGGVGRSGSSEDAKARKEE